MVPVIEAACPAALMAGLGRPHRAPPPEPATAGRAVRVPAVTGGTDREEAIALPTGLLTEGLVHGGDARRTTADWTSCPNRGTTRTTGSVCRRARRSRGPGGPSGPSSSLPLRYPKQPGSGHNGGYGRRRPRGRKQPRPPGLAKPRRPRFHTAPTAVIYSGKQEPRTARDPAGASTIVQICALSSERQQLALVMLETKEAIENIDEILEVPGLGGVLILNQVRFYVNKGEKPVVQVVRQESRTPNERLFR